jgi:hypothetical protein
MGGIATMPTHTFHNVHEKFEIPFKFNMMSNGFRIIGISSIF